MLKFKYKFILPTQHEEIMMSIFCKIGQEHRADGTAEGHRHHSYTRPSNNIFFNLYKSFLYRQDNLIFQKETSLLVGRFKVSPENKALPLRGKRL